jgi:hypothetical protein
MRSADIDTSGRVWVYTPERHKTEHHGRERRIYLGPAAQTILGPWLRAELAAYLFSPAEAEAERHAEQRAARKTRVQPSQQNRRRRKPRKTPGPRYTPDSYRQAIEYGIKAANRVAERIGTGPIPLLASAPTPPFGRDSSPERVRPGRGPGGIGPCLPRRDRGLRGTGRGQGGGGDGAGRIVTKRDRPREWLPGAGLSLESTCPHTSLMAECPAGKIRLRGRNRPMAIGGRHGLQSRPSPLPGKPPYRSPGAGITPNTCLIPRRPFSRSTSCGVRPEMTRGSNIWRASRR